MEVTKSVEDGQIVVRVKGSLDTNTSQNLKSVLDELLVERVNLCIDFSDLDYLNSAGLRVLLSAQKRSNELVSNLVIKNVNSNVMEIFDSTGFSDFLSIDNSSD